MAIFSVVSRRDHFNPVMGSPAVSYSSRNSISVDDVGGFFSIRLRPPPERVRPSRLHSDRAVVGVRERRCAGPGEGTLPDHAIASVSQLDRFQPSVQPALLLVKQTVEQQDCRFQFIGRNLQSAGYSRVGTGPGRCGGPGVAGGGERDRWSYRDRGWRGAGERCGAGRPGDRARPALRQWTISPSSSAK